MDIFFLLLKHTAMALLSTVELCLLIRAVLSWFPIRDDHPILRFVRMVTEPVIAPIRALFDKLGWFQNLPIDFSFLAAFLLVSFVSGMLGAYL